MMPASCHRTLKVKDNSLTHFLAELRPFWKHRHRTVSAFCVPEFVRSLKLIKTQTDSTSANPCTMTIWLLRALCTVTDFDPRKMYPYFWGLCTVRVYTLRGLHCESSLWEVCTVRVYSYRFPLWVIQHDRWDLMFAKLWVCKILDMMFVWNKRMVGEYCVGYNHFCQECEIYASIIRV